MEFAVRESDLDKQQHVNNVQYVQWVQDIAEAHWEARATPEQKEKYIWVVIKHEISYKKEAFLHDPILMQTYVGDTTNVTSVRHVIIKNKESGKSLAEAKTTWCLLDAESRKPAKISEEMKKVFEK
ncbi:MAG: acyl-CoA thioesterase [Christiangramia sp.]